MVNPEDAGLFMVSASLAFCEHASPAHIFSGGGEGCNPNGFRGFVHAGAAAIFSVLGRACSKLFSAVSTSAGDRTFQVLSFVVATTRAIFGPIGARCNVLEVGTADFTDGLDVHTGRQRFACGNGRDRLGTHQPGQPPVRTRAAIRAKPVVT